MINSEVLTCFFWITSHPSKLWYHICSQMVKQWWTWSCGFKVTWSVSQRSHCSMMLCLLCFSPPIALFFVIDQQLCVEKDSNLVPPQYRPNALSLHYAPVKNEQVKHYTVKRSHKCFILRKVLLFWVTRLNQVFDLCKSVQIFRNSSAGFCKDRCTETWRTIQVCRIFTEVCRFSLWNLLQKNCFLTFLRN